MGSAAGNKPKLHQSKLSFAKVDRTTYREQCAEQLLRTRAESERFRAAEAIRKEKITEQRKQKDMLRKREERAAVVEKEIESGCRDKDGKLVKDTTKVSYITTPRDTKLMRKRILHSVLRTPKSKQLT